MQMLCKVSTVFSDVRCPVCGQGFLVYWTRTRSGNREEQRMTLQHVLREQHTGADGADAHAPAFHISDTPAAVPSRSARPETASLAIPAFN